MTVIVVAITVIYGIERFQTMADYRELHHTVSEKPLAEKSQLSQGESSFNIAFGLVEKARSDVHTVDMDGLLELRVVKVSFDFEYGQ